jgi:hypothetical protein
MSYCRFSPDSNVYMFACIEGGIVCCACSMHPNLFGSYEFATPAEALVHLHEHRAKGHAVPDYAIIALEEEANAVRPSPQHI